MRCSIIFVCLLILVTVAHARWGLSILRGPVRSKVGSGGGGGGGGGGRGRGGSGNRPRVIKASEKELRKFVTAYAALINGIDF